MANDSLEKELVLFQLKIFGDGYSMPSFMVTEKDYSEKEAFKALLQKIMHNNYCGYDFGWWLEASEDILMKLDPVLHDTIEKKMKKKKEYDEDFDWQEELLEQCLKYPIEQVLKAIGDFVGYGAEFKATPYELGTSFV